MLIMERKKLFRNLGKQKLYFGMYLDDDGIVREGYSIDDSELEGDYNINGLFRVWNSLTGDRLNEDDDAIDRSYFDDIVIEFLSTNHVLHGFEGYSWNEIGEICLKTLDKVDLLGAVGRMLLENKKLFPGSLNTIGYWLEGNVNAYGAMARSSLVGNDDEGTIRDWIVEEERERMRELFSKNKNKYLIVIENSFIRDTQIASNKYIEDVFNDKCIDGGTYNWYDTHDGDLSIGIYESFSLEIALEKASERWGIDIRALKGYELK
ncbi:hypothetical protein NE686_17610 [Tissierella carlieri]|uniref:Uncharacterized protein n=1 Tax=Tissierella carlieri TaxID=689904 RepID=A0ABT1SEL0_9FIRM|nr:hypothetical protein [Tissierella carlieri]MCQ4924923.1 hypothetical protein [Tissierella carlieri]